MPDKKFFSGFSSTAVHAGHHKDPLHAHLTPIYASSTYEFDSAEQGMRRFSGEEPGHVYGRFGNPTSAEAAQKIAALEAFGLDVEVTGILHASGMAAIATLMFGTLQAGDKIISHYSLYGGTEELIHKVLQQFNVTALIADFTKPETIEALLKEDRSIKMLYIETPANPTLQCVDIEALTKLAKQYGLLVACDNTFATPYLQQPFRYGVDFVVHSTTKFLNGHGTAVGGILLGKDAGLMNSRITKAHRLLGGTASPFDAFLLLNGLKTLELRMERHCANAVQVANFLQAHPQVASVNYNGLPAHPGYAISQKQMRKAGAMLSFELKGGLQACISFLNKLQMCIRTVSLGTCDTLLCHPATMTHAGVPKEQRDLYGITEGLLRMNVGIENAEDIIRDLEQALEGS